jgi:hypothetical protein
VSAFKVHKDAIKQFGAAPWTRAANAYSSAVINSLAALSELTPDPERSRELLKSIKAQAANTSPGKALIGRFVNDVAAAQNIVDQYGPDPAARDFFNKVRRGEASLDDLTPEVAAWLKANNLSGKLRISF